MNLLDQAYAALPQNAAPASGGNVLDQAYAAVQSGKFQPKQIPASTLEEFGQGFDRIGQSMNELPGVTPEKLGQGLLSVAKIIPGALETAAGGIFGLGQQAAAGLTGLGRVAISPLTGEGAGEAFKAGTDTINNLAAQVPIAPETETGKALSDTVGGWIQNAQEGAGNFNYNAAMKAAAIADALHLPNVAQAARDYAPVTGAAGQAAAALATIMLPGKAAELIKAIPKGVSRTAAETQPVETPGRLALADNADIGTINHSGPDVAPIQPASNLGLLQSDYGVTPQPSELSLAPQDTANLSLTPQDTANLSLVPLEPPSGLSLADEPTESAPLSLEPMESRASESNQPFNPVVNLSKNPELAKFLPKTVANEFRVSTVPQVMPESFEGLSLEPKFSLVDENQNPVASTPETPYPTPNFSLMDNADVYRPNIGAESGSPIAAPDFGLVPQGEYGTSSETQQTIPSESPPIPNTYPGESVDRIAKANSLRVPIQMTLGQATGDVTQLSNEFNAKGAIPKVAQRFNDQNQALIDNLNASKGVVAPDINIQPGVTRDQALLDSIKREDIPVKKDVTEKYKALADANGGEFPLNGTDFIKDADKKLAADDSDHFLPSEIKSLMAKYREGAPFTFNKFETMRTVLGRAERKANSGAQPDGNAAHAINIVRESLESLPMTNETSNIKPLADIARKAAAERFKKMDTDPAYKAAVNDETPIGESSPIADGFINKYVVNGKLANIKNLLENTKNDPTARQLMAAGIIDNLKKVAGIDLDSNEGNFGQKNYNDQIQALGKEKLEAILGDEANHIQDIGQVARWAKQQPSGTFFNNSNTLIAGIAKKAGGLVKLGINGALPGVGLGDVGAETLASFINSKKAEGYLNPTQELIAKQQANMQKLRDNEAASAAAKQAAILRSQSVEDAIKAALH